jgi:hypothetical protein
MHRILQERRQMLVCSYTQRGTDDRRGGGQHLLYMSRETDDIWTSRYVLLYLGTARFAHYYNCSGLQPCILPSGWFRSNIPLSLISTDHHHHQCIRQWRDPENKSGEVVSSGVTKRCPLCRSASRFVTPSSHYFTQDDPKKQTAVEGYKASMARTPCR